MSLNEQFNAEALAKQLHDAVLSGDMAAVIDLVVNKKVPADSRDAEGYTPLMKAVKTANLGISALLVGNGADVNAEAQNKIRPIHLAFYEFSQGKDGAKQIPVLDLLLSFDADPLAMNTHDKEPRELMAFRAAAMGNEKALRALLENGVGHDIHNKNTESLLLVAAAKGHDGVVRMLLEIGADANTVQALGRTALRAAMEGGHSGSVKLLLDAGADTGALSQDAKINARITDLQYSASSTPEIATAVAAAAVKFEVNEAAKKGDSVRLKELLEKGAPADTVDRDGMTALLHAVKGRHQKALKVLIEYKADANAAGRDKLPALHTAIFNKDVQSIELLGAGGASTFSPDLGGNTPVQRAEKLDDPDLLKLLRRLRGEEIARLSKNAVSLEQEVSAPARAAFRRKVATP